MGEARRDGKWIHYRIAMLADPHAAGILKDVLAWLKEDQAMQRDRVKLNKVCCAAALPVQLMGAPKPTSLAAAG